MEGTFAFQSIYEGRKYNCGSKFTLTYACWLMIFKNQILQFSIAIASV